MRAKPTKDRAREATVQIALRVPLSILAGIDAYTEHLREETPTISRTDAMVGLLKRGLATVQEVKSPH